MDCLRVNHDVTGTNGRISERAAYVAVASVVLDERVRSFYPMI